MGQQQEPTPKGDEIEGAKIAKKGGNDILKLLRNGTFLVAGLLGTGCSGEKPEAPKPHEGIVAIVKSEEKACPPSGGAGGEAKKEEPKEEKKEKEKTIETRRVVVIGQGHVKVDGRYYLKTKDWDKETVWVLPGGYRLSTLDTLPEISAEFQGKNMKFAGRYYSEAEDSMAWEKGVEVEEKGATSPLVMKEVKDKEKEGIPPKILTLLGENAVRLQNPATVQYGRDIFLVDSDGRRLWKFLPSRDTYLPRYGTVDLPFINGGMVYATRARIKYEGKEMEQITTYDMIVAPNGRPFVVPNCIRRWLLTNDTLNQLKTRAEEDAARILAEKRERQERQREEVKREIVQEQGRFLEIKRISGKTFQDQRGVVWTHASGYFPSLSPGRIYGATVCVENPQWGRDARGSDILIGGTQILRWRVEGREYVEFRAPVERKK